MRWPVSLRNDANYGDVEPPVPPLADGSIGAGWLELKL